MSKISSQVDGPNNGTHDKDNKNGDQQFCQQLPKCELHAHLNGSLSTPTMKKLLDYHHRTFPGEIPHDKLNQYIEKNQTMEGFDFTIFDVVRSITDTTTAVAMATRDVIREFHGDGVRYLELRSTPREVEGRMSKMEYCESIIGEIVKAERDEELSSIRVKYLLSIDRRKLDEFDENMKLWWLLKEKYPRIVAGIDISGDPRVDDITKLIPKLLEMRQQGIKVAIHLAEILNEKETLAILGYRPDRIGHGTFIHPDSGGTQVQLEALIQAKTPVEVCLTSNVLCKTSPTYKDHHTRHLHNTGVISVMISTDDKGVFKCTLSGEYELAMKNFGWDRGTLYAISLTAIDHIFVSEEEKDKLRAKWKTWRIQNKHLFEA